MPEQQSITLQAKSVHHHMPCWYLATTCKLLLWCSMLCLACIAAKLCGEDSGGLASAMPPLFSPASFRKAFAQELSFKHSGKVGLSWAFEISEWLGQPEGILPKGIASNVRCAPPTRILLRLWSLLKGPRSARLAENFCAWRVSGLFCNTRLWPW